MGTLMRFFLTLGLVALMGAAAGAQSTDETAKGLPAPAEPLGEAADQARAETPHVGITGLPLPRFVSLRAPEVNLRTGPGVRYPIDWVYNRAGLPLEVIDEFETWRRVRDWEGSVGWVHQSMLSGDRMVMVMGKQHLLRRAPDPAATGTALVEPGVLAELRTCAGDWCEVRVRSLAGWIPRADLYGIYPDETGP